MRTLMLSAFKSILLLVASTSILLAQTSPLRAAEPSSGQALVFECGEDEFSCSSPSRWNFFSNRQSVYFAADTAELDHEAQKAVALHVEKLKADPRLRVTLVGYADDRLEKFQRLALAEHRASSVAEAMLSMGVRSRQIHINADSAEQEGVVPCHTTSCSLSYRRVEFRFHLLSADEK